MLFDFIGFHLCASVADFLRLLAALLPLSPRFGGLSAYTVSDTHVEQITSQLARVRSTSRYLLLTQRVCQWAAALLAAAVALALLDWALRLPGPARLGIGVMSVGVALIWLVTRLVRVARFAPSLADLALRAERLYPQLAGRLATAVEFAATPDAYREPAASPTTGTLATQAVGDAQRHMSGVRLSRLINPTRTLQSLGLLLLAAAFIITLIWAAPAHAALAAQRWFDPLGDHPWPTRVVVEDLTPDHALAADSPIPLQAAVTRGHSDDLTVRAWHRTRMGDTVTEWEQAVLTPLEASPTPPGRADSSRHESDPEFNPASEPAPTPPQPYEALLTPPAPVASALAQGEYPDATFEYYLEADDYTGPTRILTLVPRPAVTQVTATLTPPDYARNLISPQTLHLHQRAGDITAVSALQGSTVTLTLAFNQPLPEGPVDVQALLPGLPQTPGELAPRVASDRTSLTLSFPLTTAFDTPIALTSRHGLTSTTSRLYRFTPTPDAPPTVALTEPASDEAVTPNALIPVAALANDAIGVESLTLYAQPPIPGESPPGVSASADMLPTPGESPPGVSAGGDMPPTPEPSPPLLLTRATARQSSLTADAELDLATLTLAPGDTLTLYATAQDTFRLPGQPGPGHEPVQSAPRRLRIIDEATLVEQVRDDLATVRRAVERLATDQRNLNSDVSRIPENAPAPEIERLQNRQADLTRRTAAQARAVERLGDRAVKNRVADETLNDVLDRGKKLLEAADDAGEAAQTALDEAAEQTR